MKNRQNLIIPSFPLTQENRLEKLVENRAVFNMSGCEMNVFETRQQASKVHLSLSGLTFTAMLRGKKVMHLFGEHHFDYLPGESVILPSCEPMIIDFPDASLENPTQCIALAINTDKIAQILEKLNEKSPKIEKKDSWQIQHDEFHLKNTEEITGVIQRLLRISLDTNPAKDVLAELTLEELLIRLIQSQSRTILLENCGKQAENNRFAYVLQYIKKNIHKCFTVKELSDLACMSESHFFRSFKREFGISPVDYILRERIGEAKKLLKNKQLSITDVCFAVGFNSISYFSTAFVKYEKKSPKQFREEVFL